MNCLACCLLLLAVACHGRTTLNSVKDEVEQLEKDLAKLEKHDLQTEDPFEASKRELQEALKKKTKASSYEKTVAKLEEAKRELEKQTLEKILAEDDPVQEEEQNEAKREIYKMMAQLMEDQTEEKRDSGYTGSSCRDVSDRCKETNRACSDGWMRENCARTCHYCLFCQDDSPRCHAAYAKCKYNRTADIMKQYCNDTCGYCKTPSPKPCEESKYGCCWDGETTKMDKEASTCAECMDQHTSLCPVFIDDCMEDSIPGGYMRKNCPTTCGLCGNQKCYDEIGSEKKCEVWKENNWCQLLPDLMKISCPKTCNMCH